MAPSFAYQCHYIGAYLAIDAYLTCPAKYRYSHVLRIPVAPHHALIYGSAMHTAVQ